MAAVKYTFSHSCIFISKFIRFSSNPLGNVFPLASGNNKSTRIFTTWSACHIAHTHTHRATPQHSNNCLAANVSLCDPLAANFIREVQQVWGGETAAVASHNTARGAAFSDLSSWLMSETLQHWHLMHTRDASGTYG